MKNSDMKIFIVGTGSIGTSLASNLSKDGCEVTLIDTDEAVLHNLENSIDAIGFRGNGASYNTLKELNAKDADILIALTNSDELNLLSCFTAHKLGTRHTIARIRDVDYARNNHFYKNELGISMIINPDLASANEIFRSLRFPAATRVELFAGGRAELVELTVRPDSPMIGYSLINLNKQLGIKILFCAIVRDGKAFVPKGDTIIQEKDVLYLTGSESEFRTTFKQLRHPIKPLKNVMIAGNDRITYYLADLLIQHGSNVTIVDPDEATCFRLASALPKASIMKEDLFRYFDTMSESDWENTDAFIAVTDNDEYNLIAAMYAESQKIKKVITRVTAKSRTKVLHPDSEISFLSREDVAADRILGYTRALLNVEEKDSVESLYRLFDGKIEFIEFNVKNTDKNINIPLKELKIKKNILLAGIIRDYKLINPHGDDMLMPYDVALVASVDQQLSELGDIYE
ncbi:MAG: Trk system potassium transporter TrkA [Lachnospiraceae bacterium]|nr:Trk system potassium transporter TrkA [Lachnospiraceae bacterium]